MVTSPARAAIPREVVTRTVPCSSSTAGPSNFTSVSASTATFDPFDWILAVEPGRVCNKSPEKTAEDLGTSLPFNQATPFVYKMADAVSAANMTCTGKTRASKQHTADRKADSDMGLDSSRVYRFPPIVSCKQ